MSAKSELINKLKINKKTRQSYLRAKLNVNLPSQIRALRLRQGMKQEDLAQETEMMQPRISAMERPGATKFSLETLIRLAAAFRVGLIVKFAPFSEMLKWENEFSQDIFDVKTIDDDVEFKKEEQEQPALQTTAQIEAKDDESESIAPAGLPRLIGQVSETESAQPITPRKSYRVGQVIETDTAQPISVMQTGVGKSVLLMEFWRNFASNETITINQRVISEGSGLSEGAAQALPSQSVSIMPSTGALTFAVAAPRVSTVFITENASASDSQDATVETRTAINVTPDVVRSDKWPKKPKHKRQLKRRTLRVTKSSLPFTPTTSSLSGVNLT